jgi:drug/metabolite transporter (DMT)-like permease
MAYLVLNLALHHGVRRLDAASPIFSIAMAARLPLTALCYSSRAFLGERAERLSSSQVLAVLLVVLGVCLVKLPSYFPSFQKLKVF